MIGYGQGLASPLSK